MASLGRFIYREKNYILNDLGKLDLSKTKLFLPFEIRTFKQNLNGFGIQAPTVLKKLQECTTYKITRHKYKYLKLDRIKTITHFRHRPYSLIQV